jgi:hypothetical protein
MTTTARKELLTAIEKWTAQDRAAKQKANNYQPPITYGGAEQFSEAIERSGGLAKVSDAELRDIALGNGWVPVGNGYYHPQVGHVTCVPPCEDAEIIEATELNRAACVLIVASVVVGYCAVIVGVAWILGKLVN